MWKGKGFWPRFVTLLLLMISLPLPASGAEPAATVNLRIVNEAGALVPRASVYLADYTTNSGSFPDVPSGQTTLQLRVGSYQFSVQAVGYEPAADQAVTVKAGQVHNVTFILKAPASPGRISGTVTDKKTGAALGGVPVTLWRDERPMGAAIRADYNGTFAFAGLSPGTYRVGVGEDTTWDQAGYARDLQDVVVTAGQETKVLSTLVRKGRLTATVKTPAGAPAKDVSLIVRWVTGPDSGSGFILPGNLSGTFSVWVAPGVYTVQAEDTAYETSQVQQVTVRPDETANLTMEVKPLPAGTIRGKVKNGAGLPVTYGVVLLGDVFGNALGRDARIAPDGSFTLAAVGEGTYSLFLWAGGYSPFPYAVIRPDSFPAATVTVKAGQTTAADLTVKPQRLLTVRVESENGRVPPGARLVMDGAPLQARTDPEGNFLLEADEGELTLAAEAPGYARSEYQTIKVGAPGAPNSLTFALRPANPAGATPAPKAPPRGQIAVRVVDERGQDQPNTTVMISSGAGDQVWIATNAQGVATYGLDAGPYRVSAQHAEHRAAAPQVVQVEPGKFAAVVLTLVPGETGGVRVRVKAPGIDAGVIGALVRLTNPVDPAWPAETARVQETGEAYFGGLPPGEYGLTLVGAETEPLRVQVKASETTPIMLEQKQGGTQ